mmetsp:Transcript_4287/g.6154  ORF Transcript_4287/g.6154 Transcript_4287/m.6154 type:complete len:753 (+) Transcript_4287:174-2432(+)
MAEETTTEGKRRKLSEDQDASSSPYSLLNEDCLRVVLLWTRASDHPNLRLSCQRIRIVLNSEIYRKERSNHGYAEVKVELLSPYEQYKMDRNEDCNKEEKGLPSEEDEEFMNKYDQLGRLGEYGDHDIYSRDFRVLVDGWPLHKSHEKHPRRFRLEMKVLPRRSPFYEICDAHSSALVNLASTLFTNFGNPSVQSLKNALQDDDKLPLLYIGDFEMPFEYRSTLSTVGPLILQALLKILKGRYSLAIYVPYGEPQKTEEERNADKARDPHADLYENELTEEEIREKQKRKERFEALTQQDMRQLFRAGFTQVNDDSVVDNDINYCVYGDSGMDNDDSYYVFVTRQCAIESILTEQQALSMPISSRPPPPQEKMGLSRELFLYVRNNCSAFTHAEEMIKSWQRPLEEFSEVANKMFLLTPYDEKVQETKDLKLTFDRIDSKLQDIRDAENRAEADMEKIIRGKDSILEMKLRLGTLRDAGDLSPINEILTDFIEALIYSTLESPIPPDISIGDALVIIERLETLSTEQEQNVAGFLTENRQAGSEIEDCIPSFKGKIQDYMNKRLKEEEAKLDDLREGINVIMNKADSDESRYQTILASDAIHAYAANGNLTFLKILLELLPEPSKQSSLVLNHLDQLRLTPLMVFAGKGRLGGGSLEYAESLIGFGADKNVVQSRTGLSALGYFRQGRRLKKRIEVIFGLRESYSMEVARMEGVLTPDQGPTKADEAVLVAEKDEIELEEEEEEGLEDWSES